MPQTADSPAPAVSARAASPAWQSAAGFALFVACLALCIVGYLAFAAPGPWLGAAPTLRWTARELSVNRGSAQLAPPGLVVTAPDSTGSVVIALNTSFRAHDYPVIAWDALGIPDNVDATLLWYSDIYGSRVFRRPVTIEGGRMAPIQLAQDAGWLGRIGGLALVFQGNFTDPMLLRGAAAKPMSALQVLDDRAREWLAFAPWTGASINSLTDGSDTQELPLPLLLAAGAGLAASAYAGLRRWKFRSLRWATAAGLASILLAAWIMADARWQWNLMRQAAITWRQYGGKTWDERHRASEDGALFGFIERVRNKLPAPPARVFMTADLAYFRARGAYHLYPYNVYYDPSSPAIPPPGVVRQGDYLVVYQRRGVQYDAAERRLRWDGYPAVGADLLLTDAGAALFEIR